MHNFNAGPSILPKEVFEEASRAILDFNNTGLSILEIGHRTPLFENVMNEARSLVRELMSLDNDHEVLFLHGGASTQFMQVPMNLLNEKEMAAYTDTDVWGTKAIKEAKLYGHVEVVCSSKDRNYTYLPKDFHVPATAKYLHITTNNTIYGTQWQDLPFFEKFNVPLVADMSSDILSRQVDFNKFDLIYAGAQKNVGAAGVNLVVVNKNILGQVERTIPTMMDYRNHIENGSMLNTPPVFAVYVCMLTLKWLKENGGVAAVEKLNHAKATLFYNTLDSLPIFKGTVANEDRSFMNAVFVMGDAALEKEFAERCKQEGLYGVKGHRSVGGFRVSMYNALPLESVVVLTEVMKDFANKRINSMAIIQPFQALRPKQELADKVASRPYDVLNSTEAKEEAKGNPFSFLHITKAEIDLPDGTDVHSQSVYDQADQNLHEFQLKGIVFTEQKPCYYIYRLIMDGRSQTGLVCVSSVQDYFDDVIKKHEFTRPEKEKDRIDHMKTIHAQTGNVFLAYNNVTELDTIINSWKDYHSPEYDFTANDGIQHTIWVVNDDSTIKEITSLFAQKVAATYIADGHHRAASAAKVSKELKNSSSAGYFLTTIFPASELAILDYNRVVKDLNGQDTDDFISHLQDDFMITRSPEPVKPAHPHEFGMYLDKQWYILTSRKDTYTLDPIGVLDVTILSNNILSKLLGIKDQRTDKRIDFVGGIRGLGELEKRVNSGEMKVAFSLYPVTIQQLFDIADSGNVMPPKSTWFEPKLRDGLLTHLI